MPTAETLMRQAWMTAHEYTLHAKMCIDKIFGEGYAAKHPELVGAFIQTCAADFHAMYMTNTLDNHNEILVGISGKLEALRTDHPLMGETFSGLTEAIQNIAAMLANGRPEKAQ